MARRRKQEPTNKSTSSQSSAKWAVWRALMFTAGVYLASSLRSGPQSGFAEAQVRHLWPQQRAHSSQQQQHTQSQQQQQQQQQLGHYAFETAPAMEPPSVRKPPYVPSNELCSGSDLFAGFSPKDTLCGDLNRGSVPVNPLGQSITEQPYPFELIKNKTLQFLARALPVLKSEYESIPKVARFLPPPNHLLNPTHQLSALSDSSLFALNQLQSQPAYTLVGDGATSGGGGSDAGFMAPDSLDTEADAGANVLELASDAMPMMSYSPPATSAAESYEAAAHRPLNRWRRWAPLRSGEYIAQMTPNASLVVLSSAHHARLSGMRPINGIEANATHTPRYHLLQSQVKLAQQRQRTLSQQSASNSSIETTTGSQLRPRAQIEVASSAAQQVASAAANQSQPAASASPQARSAESHQTQPSGGKSEPATGAQAQQRRQSASSQQAAGSSSAQQAQPSTSAAASNCNEWNGITSAICRATVALVEGDRAPAWLQFAKFFLSSATGSSQMSSPASSAAASLSSPTSDYASLASGLWSLLGGGGGGTGSGSNSELQASAKSAPNIARTSPSSAGSLTSVLLAPIAAYLTGGTGPKLDAGNATGTPSQQATGASEHKSALAQLRGSTMARLALAGWTANAVASFVDHYFPNLFPPVLDSRQSFARRKRPFASADLSAANEIYVDTPASAASELSPLYMRMGASAAAANPRSSSSSGGGGGSQSSTGKQPPTPCPSVEEYISPTFARNYQGQWKYVVQIPHEGYFTQTIQRTACVKQKCDFTDGVCHESPRWVSLLVAEIYYPNAVFNTATPAQLDGRQTVATAPTQQQIQQRVSGATTTNSMAMSPTTGSVSVAQQQQALAAAAAAAAAQANEQQAAQARSLASYMGSVSSDPLQMTDSLSMYKHYGLHPQQSQVAFASAAATDPFEVAAAQQAAYLQQQQQQQQQKLASAYNNNQQQQLQLQQRNGYMQQPAQIEARSSPDANQPQALLNSDYIAALAAATLQQNPHLTLTDLIRSLQMQWQSAQSSAGGARKRKRRDLHDSHAMASSSSSSSSQQSPTSAHNLMASSQLPTDTLSNRNGHTTLTLSDPSLSQTINDIPNGNNEPTTKKQKQHNLHRHAQNAPMQTSSTQLQSGQANNNGAQVSGSSSSPLDQSNSAATAASNPNQLTNNAAQECDGFDKIGCYVVRVYYDWFLVNGSCKCWKTSPSQLFAGANNNSPGQQVSPASSSSSSQGNNSNFLRRIFFTGRR